MSGLDEKELERRLAAAMQESENAYKKMIDICVQVIGYKAASEVLGKEVQGRLDNAWRQFTSLDGAFANDAADIVREYPRWNIRFEIAHVEGSESKGGKPYDQLVLLLEPTKMTEEERDKEAAEINDKVQKAALKYWKFSESEGKFPIRILPMIEDEQRA